MLKMQVMLRLKDSIRNHFVIFLYTSILCISSSYCGEHYSLVTCYDGDTCTVINSSKTSKLKIRLYGIEAPEKDSEQPYWEESKKFLEKILKNKDFKIENKGTSYKRTVALIRLLDGTDVSSLMVDEGWAYDYKEYSNGEYMEFQKNAQKKKRGFWASDEKRISNYCYKDPLNIKCKSNKDYMP